jgi:ABC-type uncharacterized transport system auxiliary subunit
MIHMSKLLVSLGDERKLALRRLAAQRTLATGEDCDMTKLVLEAVDAVLSGSSPAASDANDGPTIKVKLLPDVAKAVRRARLNSGQPVDTIVNQALVEAFQMEGA